MVRLLREGPKSTAELQAAFSNRYEHTNILSRLRRLGYQIKARGVPGSRDTIYELEREPKAEFPSSPMRPGQ